MIITTNNASLSALLAEEKVGFWVQFYQEHLPDVVSFLLRLLLCLVIWYIGRKLIHVCEKILHKALAIRHVDVSVQHFLGSLLRWVFYVLLLLLIVRLLGVPSSSIIAVIGSAGLAIGLAIQGSLSNFAGGVLILLLHPFRVGDYIIEDAHKNEGTVRSIDLFYTTLTTLDNRTVIIPNGSLSNSSLTNVTAQKNRQLILPIGISYQSDLKKAKELFIDLLQKYPTVIQDGTHACQVIVSELAESCVMLEGRCYLPTEQYWNTRWALTEQIKLLFDQEGIEIPYPQMDVHVKSAADQ